MSEKGTALNENAGWLNDIGFTGLIQNSMDYDEIPGFVNSGVFGRFSLDDLDFGDDLTKGRIDFDDEYLLKSPASGTTSFSQSSIAKAEPRDSYPKRDSSGGYYHPPHGSAKTAERRVPSYADTPKKTHESVIRQMPTVGRTIQERVFEGLEEVAGDLSANSKFLESAKSFMDKAPTKWKLFEEQRRSSAIDRKQSVRNHQVSAERPESSGFSGKCDCHGDSGSSGEGSGACSKTASGQTAREIGRCREEYRHWQASQSDCGHIYHAADHEAGGLPVPGFCASH